MAATVGLSIAGRRYEIACDEGQETRLQRLALEIDRRAQSLLATVGPVSDARLLVMVALTLTDDLTETSNDDRTDAIAESLTRLALRIESIAERVEKA